MRAFGSCAFLMLTLILCIGPLARLDARFLPLLYNRRHFGVLTALDAGCLFQGERGVGADRGGGGPDGRLHVAGGGGAVA